MATSPPKQNQKLTLKEVDGKPGKVYMPLQVQLAPVPTAGPGQLLLRPTHVALNHRDFFLRQKLYPAPSFTTPMLADGCCTVLAPGTNEFAAGSRVILNPGHGWDKDPLAPESNKGYAILGGTSLNPLGTATLCLAIDAVQVEKAPAHLNAAEAAALPLTGLTAWRAVVTKSGAAFRDANLLVTGIGGGVACNAVQFAVAHGARVWVSSSDPKKIDFAVKTLGAQGGVNYRDKDWDKQLLKMLPKERPLLDAVVDGAGGDTATRSVRMLKQGGVFVSYGMTVGPVLPVPMGAVLKHLEIRGSTMGSRKEFADMVRFVNQHKIKPAVSECVTGALADLDKWDALFEQMRSGSQTGKLVYEIDHEASAKWNGGGSGASKL